MQFYYKNIIPELWLYCEEVNYLIFCLVTFKVTTNSGKKTLFHPRTGTESLHF